MMDKDGPPPSIHFAPLIILTLSPVPFSLVSKLGRCERKTKKKKKSFEELTRCCKKTTDCSCPLHLPRRRR